MGSRLAVLAACLFALAGCGGGESVGENDSMSSVLEQAKKDQGVTGTEFRSKEDQKEVDPTKKAPETKDDPNAPK